MISSPTSAMDLAAIRGDGVSDIERDSIEQLVKAQPTKALGDGGRNRRGPSNRRTRSSTSVGGSDRSRSSSGHSNQHPARADRRRKQERDEEGEADVRPAEDVVASARGTPVASAARSRPTTMKPRSAASNADRDGERPSSKPPAPPLFAAATSKGRSGRRSTLRRGRLSPRREDRVGVNATYTTPADMPASNTTTRPRNTPTVFGDTLMMRRSSFVPLHAGTNVLARQDHRLVAGCLGVRQAITSDGFSGWVHSHACHGLMRYSSGGIPRSSGKPSSGCSLCRCRRSAWSNAGLGLVAWMSGWCSTSATEVLPVDAHHHLRCPGPGRCSKRLQPPR